MIEIAFDISVNFNSKLVKESVIKVKHGIHSNEFENSSAEMRPNDHWTIGRFLGKQQRAR